MKRTMYCGQFRREHEGMPATAAGWVNGVRDMGGVIFIDLRDREGILQVVVDARHLDLPEQFAEAERLRAEYVVEVEGVIRPRDVTTYNAKLPTGEVELLAGRLTVLARARHLPYHPAGGGAREETRLKHRYLDLRRPDQLANLRARSDIVRAAREYLDGHSFIEVETPILTKSTPEGARDYLVPSRTRPGSCYALPQSPQLYKQLLMVGGLDRYYQMARCFRDEDLRADRQPEFTQIDVEMSFVSGEDVISVMEGLVARVFARVKGREIALPLRRISWLDAMDRYGSDKPDLRYDLPIIDVTDIARGCGFSVFVSAAARPEGVVRALRVESGADLTRAEIERLTALAEGYGAKGMAWIAVRPDGEVYSILTKFLSDSDLSALLAAAGAGPGDFILFCADSVDIVRRVLGGLRADIADLRSLIDPEKISLLVVTDFPQFEYDRQEGRYVSMHHPFTQPHPDDMRYLRSDPGRVRALAAYDIVLNGVELGGGSMRINDPDMQREVLRALGLSDGEISARFGFLLDALGCGAPPHGGFALGLDRLAMLMLGADSLRDVIAFPKTRDAACPLTGAPDRVGPAQLDELHLRSTGDSLAGLGPGGAPAGRRVDVEAIARLARLPLSEAERQAIEREFTGIVAFADRLSALDTSGVPASERVGDGGNVFREDRAVPPYPREALLGNAPEARDGYILVPRAVE